MTRVNMTPTNSASGRLRAAAPAFGVLAAMATFALALLTAPVVFGGQANGDGFDVTSSDVVASGKSKHFGAWELVASRTSGGDRCVGLRWQDPRAEGAWTLSEGCGGADLDNQVGSIVNPNASFMFGRVRDDARSVIVKDDGTKKREAGTITGRDGRKYVAVEVEEAIGDAEVTVADAAGRGLGRVGSSAVGASE
jgi:hypothetical protein